MPGIEETEKRMASEPHEEQKQAAEEREADKKREVQEGDGPAPQPLEGIKTIGNG